jgi:CheY-like chemotaxis protein
LPFFESELDVSLAQLKASLQPTTGRNDGTSKPKVVVVDDNASFINSLRAVLRLKYEVTTCLDPFSGVEAVRNQQPHVVILDIKMPERDGFWVFREIRKFNAAVPIIFNSAYQDALDNDTLLGGFQPFGYVAKGGDLPAFLDLIARAVASTTAAPAQSRA